MKKESGMTKITWRRTGKKELRQEGWASWALARGTIQGWLESERCRLVRLLARRELTD